MKLQTIEHSRMMVYSYCISNVNKHTYIYIALRIHILRCDEFIISRRPILQKDIEVLRS